MDEAQLRIGPFVLDVGAGVVLRDDGAEVILQPLVYRLLLRLAERPGAIVPHEALMRHLWPDVRVTEASLTQAVRRLRKALGTADLVRSVPRRGYRLDADVSPVATAPSTAPRTPALRLPPDRFVGREAALAELARRVQERGERLITLTGPAGVGKTRLARTFAASGGRVWFVDLQAAAEAEDVVREVARGVGAREGAGVAEIGLHLARAGGVLVLDNFEQLVAAAAQTVEAWREAAPELVQIVTSRTVLGLRGERVVTVEPLPQADAVALFADRADLPADEPGVAELVAALDGLPLAVELAAARARVLAPRELLDALRERFVVLRSGSAGLEGRHRSLRAALDDSWDLLSAAERQALSELSVFRGALSVDDAAAVIAARGAPLDLVQALVDQSMLRVLPGGRFALLPTIRAYVEERSDGAVVAAAEVRHGRRLARLGAADRLRVPGNDAFRGGAPPEASTEPRDALDDLIAACRRAIGRRDPDVAGPTALAAWAVLRRTGPAGLGVALLEGADEVAGHQDVDVLGWLGEALLLVHQLEPAVAARRAARALALERGDRREAAVMAIGAAAALRYLNRFDEALALLAEARGELEAAGDAYHVALSHQVQSATLARAGEGLAALEHAVAAVARFRTVGRDRPIALAAALQNQAIELGMHGRYGEAEASYDEARALVEAHGDHARAAQMRMNQAILYAYRGEPARCAEISREAAHALREAGRPYDEAMAWTNLASALVELGRTGEAEGAAREGLAIGRALGARDTVGAAIGALATARGAAGALDEAVALIGEADRVLAEPPGVASADLVAAIRLDGAELHLALGAADVALDRAAQAEPVLRRGWHAAELTRLLAVKGQALAAVGDREGAEAALTEAEALASRLSLAPGAPASRRIAAARAALGR
jgi:predicted ATPase/DNA-binding winged helix-turn-helix (wHTH) protein